MGYLHWEMPTNHQTFIDARIEKLRLLKELLNDPEMLSLVRTMLASMDGPTVTPVPRSDSAPRRKYSRRGGSLIDKTYKGLREYGEPTTARELAQFMASGGYKFKARDPNIAVSKALRILTDAGKIQAKRGDHAKAPIVYRLAEMVNVGGDDKVPVQGELTH